MEQEENPVKRRVLPQWAYSPKYDIIYDISRETPQEVYYNKIKNRRPSINVLLDNPEYYVKLMKLWKYQQNLKSSKF